MVMRARQLYALLLRAAAPLAYSRIELPQQRAELVKQ
jgi:hypothetical protein